MTLREILQTVNRDKFTPTTRLCKVVSVDDTARTCKVLTVDTEVEILGVRLQVEVSNGVYYKPSVGSAVVVSPIADFEFVVVMFSALDKIVYLDGSYEGIVKVGELQTQLNKTNEVLQAVVDSLSGWTAVANDGAAALKIHFTSALGAKVVGNYNNLANDKIHHGTV